MDEFEENFIMVVYSNYLYSNMTQTRSIGSIAELILYFISIDFIFIYL